EELMDRTADLAAEPGNGPEGVSARPQVRQRPQELERVLLLLQRVGLDVGLAVNDHARGLNLRLLPLGGRGFDEAFDRDAPAGGEALDVAFVVGQRAVRDDLHVALTRAVVELQEAEATFGVTPGANPALQPDLAVYVLGPSSF